MSSSHDKSSSQYRGPQLETEITAEVVTCEPTTHRLSKKVNMNRQRIADMKVQGNRQQYRH